MKTILLLASIFTVTLLSVTSAPLSSARQLQQPAPQQSPLPSLDQVKAKDFTVTTLEGERVSLNSLLGEGKAVVIDFWATWCGPCRVEIPHLQELHKKYGKDGLIVIGLNLEDPVEDKQAVKKFVKDFGMGYQSVFAPSQVYKFLNSGAPAYRIPQTIVYGADGAVVRRLVGYNPRIGREVLNRAVEKAIGSGQEKKLSE
jgi:thiol-disulfide isomerase/thioredoxin